MITVKIYGDEDARTIVGTITTKALRKIGLKVGSWSNVPPNDEDTEHYDEADNLEQDVVILEMTSEIAD